jgi:hypothetical protein
MHFYVLKGFERICNGDMYYFPFGLEVLSRVLIMYLS